jgi:hypothetical protein
MSPPIRQTEIMDRGLTLDDLTRRIARAMRRAAAIADDCQDAIDWDDQGALSHETVARLQGLDMLSQQLVELGRVLDRLANEGLSGAAPRTLLEDVRLGDLKRRLEGAAAAGAPGAEVW